MSEGTDFAADQKSVTGAWLVDPRVEGGFAEIGRAVANAAMREAQEPEMGSEYCSNETPANVFGHYCVRRVPHSEDQ